MKIIKIKGMQKKKLCVKQELVQVGYIEKIVHKDQIHFLI